MQSETLRNTNVLDAAEDLHYLYYSLSFVTFDPSILRMRLSIKADRPLTGRLSPGEQHTIEITIAIAYSDVSGTDLPEIPMFLQSFNRGSDRMSVTDSGASLFLRVFGARFDRQFFQDELESLDTLQNTIRTPSRFSIRECIDLPVRFLDGIVCDRNVAVNPVNLQEHKVEIQCSRKGAMASYPDYTYAGSRCTNSENNTQCFNLPFLRFLASIPLIKVEEGQSVTFPELLLHLPDVDVYAQRERRQQQALVSEHLAYARNSLASRPGADVLFLSGRSSSSKQRKHAIDAMCAQLSSSQSLQNPYSKETFFQLHNLFQSSCLQGYHLVEELISINRSAFLSLQLAHLFLVSTLENRLLTCPNMILVGLQLPFLRQRSNALSPRCIPLTRRPTIFIDMDSYLLDTPCF